MLDVGSTSPKTSMAMENHNCLTGNTWMFPKIGVPQNGWLILENPIKMDDLGVPLFSETPTSSNGCFSIVMLVFPGCIDWVYHPNGAFVKIEVESMM